MKTYSISKEGYNFISIKNNAGLEVILCDLGASIFQINYDNKIMTHTTIRTGDYFTEGHYFGKTIGRVAGRLANSILKIEDKEYKLSTNEDPTSLHGGHDGISTKVFSYKIKEEKESTKVIFTYLSPDGESGYPGNAKFTITYEVKEEESTLYMAQEAECDKDCMISLTNHAFFCLNEKSNDDLKLCIKASQYVEVDPKYMIPQGIKPVTKSLDFRNPKLISKDINDSYLQNSRTKGYDHYFLFDEEQDEPVVLAGSNYELVLKTDYPGLQIYTDNYEDNFLSIGSGAIKNRSIALEPEVSPFQDRILKAGEKYSYHVNYNFRKI